MEIREATGRFARVLTWSSTGILIVTAIYTLNRAMIWQNSIRLRMEMVSIDSAYPLSGVFVAIATALIVILLFRLLLFAAGKVVDLVDRYLPRRVSIVLGGGFFALMLIAIVEGVIVRAALHALDEAFAVADGLLDDTYEPPRDDRATGSAQSFIAWN